jgi:hypothetical protein
MKLRRLRYSRVVKVMVGGFQGSGFESSAGRRDERAVIA